MRLIGHLTDEVQARRFASFLVVQGVAMRVEQDETGWALWIRDEDQVQQARDALTAFQAAPDDAQYQSAEKLAAQQQRAAQNKQRASHGRLIDMSSRWRGSGTGPRPLTMTLAVLSVIVFMMTGGGDNLNSIMGDLLFCRIDIDHMIPKDGFASIRQGEIWRLVTPIFLHFGMAHLIFNLLALFSLASPIERSRGTPMLGWLTISIAVVSNILQFISSGNPLGGGLSGVLYGLFGYSWMISRQEPDGPIRMPLDSVVIMMGFFFLCILRELPPFDAVLGQFLPHIGNTAHATGLVLGVVYGLLPYHLRRWRNQAEIVAEARSGTPKSLRLPDYDPTVVRDGF